MRQRKYLIMLASWAMLIAGYIYISTPPAVTDVAMRRPFVYFPFEIGQWKGKEVIGPKLFINSTADDMLTREYENAGGVKVVLYMAYFNSLGKETQTPSIRAIWWEKGFTVKDLGDEKVVLAGEDSSDISVKGIMANYGDERYFCVYCYRLGDKYILDRTEFKLMTSVSSILKRPNNAFVFQVNAELTIDDPEGTMKVTREFLSEVFSLLVSEFLPQ